MFRDNALCDRIGVVCVYVCVYVRSIDDTPHAGVMPQHCSREREREKKKEIRKDVCVFFLFHILRFFFPHLFFSLSPSSAITLTIFFISIYSHLPSLNSSPPHPTPNPPLAHREQTLLFFPPLLYLPKRSFTSLVRCKIGKERVWYF